ncbi:MAG TPA: helix-turn-helix domain-containing protein [Puia sp.]|jgi:DNA-binding HxlR family transcriptional regulator|nr:helix-turn-helix domain-containing protein [Puia sp.]
MQNKSGKIIGIGDGRTLDTGNCPVRHVLDRIGDKWSTLVILILGDNGIMRFNEISQTIGDISQKMLTTTLRNLEADGLISRKMYPQIPPRVEYELTELGKGLLPLIRALEAWADENFQTIKKNRKRYAAKLPATR